MSDRIVTGMVISSMPMNEYDRRLELLTGSFGRISVFARGARKLSSDLVSSSRVFAFGQFELFQGRSSYTLKSAKISNYFTELSDDIDLLCYGQYFLEVARYFSRENVEATDLLKLVYVALRTLPKGIIRYKLVRAVFEMKALELNGICPSEDDILRPDSRFSSGSNLSQSAAYAVKYVLSSPVEKLYTFTLTESVEQEFCAVASHLMNILVDRKFHALDYLEL